MLSPILMKFLLSHWSRFFQVSQTKLLLVCHQAGILNSISSFQGLQFVNEQTSNKLFLTCINQFLILNQNHLLRPVSAGIYCNKCGNLNKKCTNDSHPEPHASNMKGESKKHSSRNSNNIVSPKVYVNTKILPSTPSSSS